MRIGRILIQMAAGAALAAAMPAAAQPDDAAPPVDPPATLDTGASQAGGDEAHELAKQLANPVANLISVPFQENIDFDIGPYDGVKSVLNVQPVVPFHLSTDWNLIVRTIVPVVYQQDITAQGANQFGLGDTTQSFFLSPSHPSNGIIWAAGPVFVYPTNTDPALGGAKWGAGPTGLILKQSGKNTFGVLANHVWSVAGDDTRPDISSTFLQPFFSHTTAKATTYGLNAEASYDWLGDHWVVPINATATQLTAMGRQRVSIGGGVRYYVERPEGGPRWGVRLIFTLLFPK